jgi:hypothetical protein
MLKPLKLLSKTAVDLSETSGLSTPGAADEDDISVASSISSIEDMREETPDLYRNSTLGLFEGGEMGDDHSSYGEDEDDEEMYDEEMYEDEEIGEENESDTSDEDEEEGGDDMDVSNHSLSVLTNLTYCRSKSWYQASIRRIRTLTRRMMMIYRKTWMKMGVMSKL